VKFPDVSERAGLLRGRTQLVFDIEPVVQRDSSGGWPLATVICNADIEPCTGLAASS
jgi:hypothetical protein